MKGSGNIRYQAYIRGLITFVFEEKTQEQIARHLGVNARTIWSWNRKLDWEWVKNERRKHFAGKISEVDRAMFVAATKDRDTAAAKLLYERFDGWTPTSKILSEHSISEAEVDKALDELITRKRAVVDALQASAVDADGRSLTAEAVGGEAAAPAR